MPTIEDRIKDTIKDHLGLDDIPYRDDELIRDLGADNLDTVELALKMEQDFEIEISDDELAHARTVGDWIDVVEPKCKKEAA